MQMVRSKLLPGASSTRRTCLPRDRELQESGLRYQRYQKWCRQVQYQQNGRRVLRRSRIRMITCIFLGDFLGHNVILGDFLGHDVILTSYVTSTNYIRPTIELFWLNEIQNQSCDEYNYFWRLYEYFINNLMTCINWIYTSTCTIITRGRTM